MKYKNIKYYAMAIIGHAIPRNSRLWITGKIEKWEYTNTPPKFFDNSKYFYLYLVNHTNEKVYWVSSSKEELSLLKSLNLPVVYYNSFHGKWIVLRAKYSFQHYGFNQINRILQFGMTQINFWHGTPLKKIGYDVVGVPDVKKNSIACFLDSKGKCYFSSTSDYLSHNILQHAFNLDASQMLNMGYPRTDILRLDKKQALEFCKKYAQNLIPYINLTKNKRVFLYMPTYRDDDIDYFTKANIDYKKLNETLVKNNAVFFLKLHPLTKDVNIPNYTNIFQINNDVDIYPFLIFVDYLVTDYSSILFDFLPLDREIIFIPYDLNKYTSTRELYFDYKEFVPGVQYNDFNEFISAMDTINSLDYSEKRNKVKDLFITNYNFDACEKVYRFIKEQENNK